MGNRLNEDNDVFTFIRDLERQSNEIKLNQIVGSDAVKTYKLGTPSEWDRDVTVSSSYTGGITQDFTVRYEPDNPIEGKPPAAFQIATSRLITGSYPYIDYLDVGLTIRRVKVTNPLVQEWTVSAFYSDGHGTPIRYRMKIWVIATGRGTVTIV